MTRRFPGCRLVLALLMLLPLAGPAAATPEGLITIE